MSAIRIGVVGMGKIAVDQHLPAIAGNSRFTLAATVERSAPASATNFTSHGEMLAAAERLDAVARTAFCSLLPIVDQTFRGAAGTLKGWMIWLDLGKQEVSVSSFASMGGNCGVSRTVGSNRRLGPCNIRSRPARSLRTRR